MVRREMAAGARLLRVSCTFYRQAKEDYRPEVRRRSTARR
jgi:hypothetical protein